MHCSKLGLTLLPLIVVYGCDKASPAEKASTTPTTETAEPASAPARTAATAPAPKPKAKKLPCGAYLPEECRKLCDEGDMESCRQLASHYALTQHDDEKAAALDEKCCEGGSAGCCNSLASAFELGSGRPKDPAKADALHKKAFALADAACKAGKPWDCSLLSDAYSIGIGVEKDEAKAKAADAKATKRYLAYCNDGHATSCNTYASAMAIAKRFEKSFEYSVKACDLGDPDGCSFAGGHLEEGDGTAKDIEKAKSYYDRGCIGGNVAACSALKRL